ncbi:MAG TPA: sigma-70 family RNA polymerase sigma factor [Tepidisphaeraceae bacterium]|jgi:RNA polymerase sigma factor (sigma-70 family)|nr:sigma-70 family RNA polymerase sigma factor [Tepidisphaeraceae bacterium]
MAKFRLDSLAQLSRQMAFAPQEVRSAQIAAAEDLLYLIDPARAYPIEFVIYKITGYRPRGAQRELLTGMALQHDLGLLIEQVSVTLETHTAHVTEPVLCIEDVCERFNVTSKTIQRWRRKGLAARRFIYGDGKRRVGFLLRSVERFVAAHGEQVAGKANLSQVGEGELHEILRRARRLASCGCPVSEITRRVGRAMNRSPLAVLHTIKKHDQENSAAAILAGAGTEVAEPTKLAIAREARNGATIADLAARMELPRWAVYRAMVDERTRRLLKRRTRFYDDPLYREEEAADAIRDIVAGEEIGEEPKREELRVPRDLPPYLQELYRTPLLSRSKERALFLKFNFHKYQFAHARRRIDAERVRNRDLVRLEEILADAAATKNQIVRANLRLVVSVARKHVRPGVGLLELVSEGNLVLMRAVEGFDLHRGHRFSTYATLALMKGFARSVPQMVQATRRNTGDAEALAAVPDSRPIRNTERLIERDEVQQLLSRLNERERDVLAAHFGLDDQEEEATYAQVGARLGLSKERVRQIERGALAKLRENS